MAAKKSVPADGSMRGQRTCVNNNARQKTITDMPYWKRSGFFRIGRVFRDKNSTIRTLARSCSDKHLLFPLGSDWILLSNSSRPRPSAHTTDAGTLDLTLRPPNDCHSVCHHYSPVNISHILLSSIPLLRPTESFSMLIFHILRSLARTLLLGNRANGKSRKVFSVLHSGQKEGTAYPQSCVPLGASIFLGSEDIALSLSLKSSGQ